LQALVQNGLADYSANISIYSLVSSSVLWNCCI